MITVGKIAENGETVHQSVVWSRCSANQEIRKSYQKASLELLFLQIWKSRKLEKPYHKASLRLQFLCFQEFNKTQTVKLQCLGISSTLAEKQNGHFHTLINIGRSVRLVFISQEWCLRRQWTTFKF